MSKQAKDGRSDGCLAEYFLNPDPILVRLTIGQMQPGVHSRSLIYAIALYVIKLIGFPSFNTALYFS